MEICIIGLPQTGKTTIFNALTKGRAEAVLLSSSHFAPNIGISKVPDDRLKNLANIFNPKKIINAEIKYTDIVGIQKTKYKGDGIYGPFLNYLSSADAIIQVVRAFKNAEIPHIEGTIDPKRDISNMELELIISDLIIVERRIEKIESSLKGAKGHEHDVLIKELQLMKNIKAALENETPVWRQGYSKEEIKSLSNFNLLTVKPMLIIVNIDEQDIYKIDDIENEFRKTFSCESFDVIALCGKLEMELSRLDETEAREFMKMMGIKKSAIERVISQSYSLLGLISFFTTVSDELRAWTIPYGTTAVKAAGKIHTDMEKGFIKAEVINYDDLIRYNSIAEAKRHGAVRLEGKNYIVKDGDIITFMFNV